MNGGIHVGMEDPTLCLPRLLCLHGGGSNAKIFKSQCRVLSRQLSGIFRLCFVDAPWLSQAGPDVTAVYQDYKPFRRWLRWQPWHPEIEPSIAVKELERTLDLAMEEDDRKGATGEWVGLLGFSQGAKICASLLFRQQVRTRAVGGNHPTVRTSYRFAVLLSGRGPLVSLDPELVTTPALVDASEISPAHPSIQHTYKGTDHILQLPTIHVHGLQDQGLPIHRHFMQEYFQSGTTRLVEWNGDHRVPIKSRDVAALVAEILDVARETGILED